MYISFLSLKFMSQIFLDPQQMVFQVKQAGTWLVFQTSSSKTPFFPYISVDCYLLAMYIHHLILRTCLGLENLIHPVLFFMIFSQATISNWRSFCHSFLIFSETYLLLEQSPSLLILSLRLLTLIHLSWAQGIYLPRWTSLLFFYMNILLRSSMEKISLQ